MLVAAVVAALLFSLVETSLPRSDLGPVVGAKETCVSHLYRGSRLGADVACTMLLSALCEWTSAQLGQLTLTTSTHRSPENLARLPCADVMATLFNSSNAKIIANGGVNEKAPFVRENTALDHQNGNAMRKPLIAFGLAAILVLQSVGAFAQTVIVVRHGEKLDDSADPILSPAGETRAARLAKMLAASNVRAIYTTQYKRTMLQAAPTAKLLGVIPESIPGKETATLLARIRARARDEVILVVGHSNTVSEILRGLGHPAEVTVKDEDYDNLFVVAMQTAGAPTVVHLKY